MPRVLRRESIEWLNVWMPAAHITGRRPRVLLVGDSIVNGYGPEVEKRLDGQAFVARFTTSRCVCDPAFIRELDCVLGEFRFAVIHFNNGLHGFGYTEAQYAAGYARVVAHVRRRQPQAQLGLALSTPVRQRANLAKLDRHTTPRVRQRNAAVRALAARQGLPVNDLFALMAKRPECWVEDAVHFNETGRKLQAEAVAGVVAGLLPPPSRRRPKRS